VTCARTLCGGGVSCTCGCCEPAGGVTPLLLWNRPGLSRIDYRVGTYASFHRAMTESIAGTPELAGWTARIPEDYGIAVISMWAYVSDILTFYGERGIHEAFLGTALQDRSLRRLAAMLDYLPDPGAAATAFLAYTAETGKRFEVRPRMRVQSVPGQDEKPQKFEPIESVAVEPALNAMGVYGAPIAIASGGLPAGATFAALSPSLAAASPALAVGDRLVATAGTTVEEKTLDSVERLATVERSDWRTVIRWKPAMQANGSALYKWRRKMQLFGHSAPDPWLRPVVSGGNVTFEQIAAGGAYTEGAVSKTYSFNVSGTSLSLDGTYDVGAGSWVLVVGSAFASAHRISAVATVSARMGPLSASVTRLTLSTALPATVDLRTVTVYELVEVAAGEAAIGLWPYAYPDDIAADTDRIYVRAEDVAALAGIEKGRRLVLADALGNAQAVVAAGPPVEVPYNGAVHQRIDFTPKLAAPLEAATAVMHANVAEATHGETVVDEVLGSGEASQEFQVFPLAKGPVTHVPDPLAPNGAASTLEVRVNGVRWSPVRDFYGRGPDERVYVSRVDEKGKMTVRFGDGRTGARVQSGKNNVTATYRHDLGLAGRVAAGALRTALDRPVGLKAVTNPAPSYGGADAELGDRTRENAPNRVRTFGRVVSLADFEDAAREYAGVAKARAVERWEGEEQGVWLFVAGDAGAALGTDGLAKLRAWLDARRDPFRTLSIADFTRVPVEMEVDVEVDPDYEGEVVQGAVADAVVAHFAFDARDLGEPMRLSDLYRVVQEVPGVVGADFDRLMFKAPFPPNMDRRSLRPEGVGWAPLQPRLLLYGQELAVIEDPAADLVVNLGIAE